MVRAAEAHVETGSARGAAWSFVHRLSLRHKLIGVTMLTCLVSLLLAGAVSIAWEWMALRRALIRELATHARILAANCRAAITFRDTADAADILRGVEAIPSIRVAGVYTDDGTLLAGYRRGETMVVPSRANELRHGPVFGNGTLTLTRPVLLDDKQIGTVYLGAGLESMRRQLGQAVAVILAALLLSSLVACPVCVRLQHVISHPILHLVNVARLVSDQKQYTIRAEPHGSDEVGLLIEAFNEMLAQIEQRDAALVEANERLEARVSARTAELTAANESLIQEVAFRERAEQVLTERTERIINHQRVLLRLTKEARSRLRSMTAVVTEEAARTLAVERVSIWLLQERSAELVCKESYSLSRGVHDRGMRLKAVDYPEYFAEIENNRILAISDAREDPRTREFIAGYLEPLGITALMNVPIRLHATLLGVVCYEHVGGTREWSPEEQDFAASVADMIALQVETSQRRRLERALARANEHLAETVRDLRRSNKELQDFAYVAAHDLKAPLRGIGTLADWIASDYGDRLDEAGRQQLQLLKGRVARLSELIEGILHYSEIGRATRRLEQVDVKELVCEVLTLLDPPRTIQVAVADGLPTVLCEKARLSQVFHNLIDNAIKYMDKPRGRIDIGCVDEETSWRFTVADNGPGIEERYFEKIFQMFQTLAPRDERESTGIGLAVVRKIVELFGGGISVESRPGEGSIFAFTLPKQEIPVDVPRPQSTAAR